MNELDAIAVLERLLRLLCRSLPAYLGDARPWARAGDSPLQAALDSLVADQRAYAARVAEAIVARGGRPDPGRFPAAMSAKNDLGLEFLLREVIADQERTAAAVARCAGEVEGDPSLHALTEEVFGNVHGHLDILREMMKAE
jgi:hypothetical protein